MTHGMSGDGRQINVSTFQRSQPTHAHKAEIMRKPEELTISHGMRECRGGAGHVGRGGGVAAGFLGCGLLLFMVGSP